jgi:hypothetical protein
MGAGYNPAAWSSFFSAQIGAAASLAGLIFVAVSINLSRIIASPLLSARAGKALVTLTNVLLLSTLCLAPGQSPHRLGWELVFLGGVMWMAVSWAMRKAARNNALLSGPRRVIVAILTQGSAVPAVAAGISQLAGRGGGLEWLLAGVMFSYVAALIDAWVLLVEIHR